jgi:hypothetical protein
MATTDETQASNRLSERLRNSLALAQTRIQTMETRAKTQWTDLPVQLRGVVDRAVARLRDTLDLPSRSEVSDLVDRLEALDRKIGALEKRQGKRAAGAEGAARDGAVDASGQGEAGEVEKPAPVETTAQRASDAKDSAEDSAEDSEQVDGKTRDKSTARKTVKSTNAGKTVKASTGRASEKRDGSSGPGHARGRKKGRR